MATATKPAQRRTTRRRVIRRPERIRTPAVGESDARKPEPWHGRWRPSSLALAVLMGVVAVAVAGLIVISILAMAWDSIGWFELGRCNDREFSCGIVGGLLVTLLPLAVAYASLVVWRVWKVRRRYVKYAQDNPSELVEGAPTPTEVVGRDDLCIVIMRDLRNRKARRPHVLVGGVGVGKTTVLVQLTKRLAEAGAVPVPIRLRESADGLDFRDEARAAFRRFAERSESASNADEVWRKLCERDLVVIIADGLEEAMDGVEGRDSAIRLAINDARARDLPLVVASRPHETLNYVDAAILRLEPLSEASACGYIERGVTSTDDTIDERVEQIVEDAEVVEAPLYMQVARELHQLGKLRTVNTPGGSRLLLRKRLLDRWTDELIAGHIRPEVPLVRAQRSRVVDTLGALACIGLCKDSLEVTFDEAAAKGELAASDVKFATTAGAQLDLVEARPQALRFRHSIMQAYLGGRAIGTLIATRRSLDAPLREPGRELLMALAMACTGDGGRQAGGRLRPRLLKAAAARTSDVKAIELLGAAVELDAVTAGATTRATTDAIRAVWHQVTMEDETALEAKLRVVSRIREGANRDGVVRRRRFRPRRSSAHDDAFDALWHICMHDESYRVRHHAAQELGTAGDAAFARLAPTLHEAIDQAEETYRRQASVDVDALRRFSLSGWLLPLFVGSVERAEVADDADRMLNRWLELTGSDMHRAVEASLAQGFKYAANRRRGGRDRVQDVLIEQANVMRERATFWFSRMALVQALTLWSLPGPRATVPDPRRRVEQWLGADEHEFVKQAALLCIRALEETWPSRYVWIDEVGVSSKVGPSSRRHDWARTRRLWISPAVGWYALHPTARQLVGDIIVLLNLAERGVFGETEDIVPREARLRRTEGPLPKCLTADGGRAHLGPNQSQRPGDGERLECVYGCKVGLCPLPLRGQKMFRGELRETFCRNQARLATERRRGPAAWQQVSRKELQAFWIEMEKRAQRS